VEVEVELLVLYLQVKMVDREEVEEHLQQIHIQVNQVELETHHP
jgi:hypothetical protein